MISITSAQLDALIVAWAYPIARVLAMFGTAPVFSNAGMPRRVRLAAGLIIGVAVAGALPPPPPIQPGTWMGIAILVQQILIGLCMGLALRMVLASIDIAGDIIGLQMGLSFATFFDPDTSGQTAVLGEFLSLMATLTFLSLNGHLLMIDALARSFELAPIGSAHLGAPAWRVLLGIGASIFATGLMIALPIVATLLITNIALGVLTRAAPQLNIFAVGFPITSTVGMLVILFSLNALSPILQHIFDMGFSTLAHFLQRLTPT